LSAKFLLCLLTKQKSLKHSVENDASDQSCGSFEQPQYRLDSGASIAEQRAQACRLAEYLQCKTTLRVSPAVEFSLNSCQCPQKPVLLTRTLKLIGNCLDDVISWAKSIPGFSSFELSSRIRLLLGGWPDVIVLDAAWRSLATSDAVVFYPGFTLTR